MICPMCKADCDFTIASYALICQNCAYEIDNYGEANYEYDNNEVDY